MFLRDTRDAYFRMWKARSDSSALSRGRTGRNHPDAPALMHRWFTASYCRVGVLWLRLVTGTDVDCATITSPDTTYLVLP